GWSTAWNRSRDPGSGFRSRSTSAIPPGRESGLRGSADDPQCCPPGFAGLGDVGIMVALATALPHRRPDLLIRPLDGGGRYVVKDPGTGAYFQLGEQEYFLLSQLDADRTPGEVCRAFEERFGDPLSEEELEGFLDLVTAQGFVPLAEEMPPADAEPRVGSPPPRPAAPAAAAARARPASIVLWRGSLFDPDRLFNRLAPRLWFLWTRGFLILSLVGIAAAGVVVWQNQGALVSRFADALNWRTAVIVWVTLLTATTLHEFAHGLTANQYPRAVPELAFPA